MKGIRTLKKILLIAFTSVFLVNTVGAALPGKWFTAKVDLSGVDGQIPIGSLGRGDLVLNGTGALLDLEEDQIRDIVELSIQQDFVLAEEALGECVLDAQADVYNKNELGYNTHKVTYNFTYAGDIDDADDALNAYVRFVPDGFYANEIKEGVFALQIMECDEYGELQRLSFTGQDPAWYYPHELEAGDVITFDYIVFLSDNDFADVDFNRIFKVDLIQADTNASALNWNAIIEDGEVFPFDGEYLNNEYYPYDINFETPNEEEEQVFEGIVEENVLLNNRNLIEEKEEPGADGDEGESTEGNFDTGKKNGSGSENIVIGDGTYKEKEPDSGDTTDGNDIQNPGDNDIGQDEDEEPVSGNKEDGEKEAGSEENNSADTDSDTGEGSAESVETD